MRRRLVAITVAAFGVVFGSVVPASAQGFGVYEQGTCIMGRGGAGVAAPCQDASGIFFNPAGLSFDQTQISLGAALIGPKGDFTNSTTSLVSTLKKAWYPVPNIYASTPLSNKVAAGIGVFAPYGLTSEWPVTAEGRFLGYKSVVQAVYVQPTLAWKASDRLSIGVGIDLTYVNLQLLQRVDLSKQAITGTPYTFANLGVKAGTDFANVDLSGHTLSAGVHAGVLYKASERLTLGARVMTGQKPKVDDGEIETQQIATGYVLPVPLGATLPAGTPIDAIVKPQFGQGGKLSNQAARTSLPLPLQAAAGLAYQASPKVMLLADYQFVQWSKFDKLVVDGEYLDSVLDENYRDTHGLRLGTEVSLDEKTAVRAGFIVHTAAAPDETVTPLLPEGSRRILTVGLGRQLTARMRIDAAYNYLMQPERAGRSVEGPNNGVYNFMAHLFGLSFSFGF